MEAVSQYITYIAVKNWSKSNFWSGIVFTRYHSGTFNEDYTFSDTYKVWVQ